MGDMEEIDLTRSPHLTVKWTLCDLVKSISSISLIRDTKVVLDRCSGRTMEQRFAVAEKTGCLVHLEGKGFWIRSKQRIGQITASHS